MSAVLSFDPSLPLDLTNEALVRDRAAHMAAAACQELRLKDRQKPHWQDMLQEAMVALYEAGDAPASLACARAKYAVMTYAQIHIFGYDRHSTSKRDYRSFSKARAPKYSVEDIEPDDHDDGPYGWVARKTRRTGTVPRPVEEQVIREEGGKPGPAREAVVAQFFYVFYGLTRKVQPETLYHAAQIMALSAEGVPPPLISDETRLDIDYVIHVIRNRRQIIKHFLSLPSLLQGMLLARGRLSVHYHHELTNQTLNRAHSYVVLFPHGAYRIRVRHGRNRPTRALITSARAVNGKPKHCDVSVGNVGTITYDDLYEATVRLTRKQERVYQAA